MELGKELNLQKKIEKIAQAIYLVSNHLKDMDPLKWEIRKESLRTLSCVKSFNEGSGRGDTPPDLVVDALSSSARDLISYLSLASLSGLISRNNANIIILEIETVLSAFGQMMDENAAKAGFVLSEDFFGTDSDLSSHVIKKLNKGQSMGSISDKQNITKKDTVNIKDKKNTRQERIIMLLKNQTNLTIKDFVKVINDCSEKTIQRELISLVERGVVKREGERRWSTYSLK